VYVSFVGLPSLFLAGVKRARLDRIRCIVEIGVATRTDHVASRYPSGRADRQTDGGRALCARSQSRFRIIFRGEQVEQITPRALRPDDFRRRRRRRSRRRLNMHRRRRRDRHDLRRGLQVRFDDRLHRDRWRRNLGHVLRRRWRRLLGWRRLLFHVEGLQVFRRVLDYVVREAGDNRITERELEDGDDDDRQRPIAAKLFLLGVRH
jgi:hypothetical protein